jgi:hypothetical protein
MAPVWGDGGGEMKASNSEAIVILVIIALSVAASTFFGLVQGGNLIREEAVIKGHAEWVADTNGKPQFKWKECK